MICMNESECDLGTSDSSASMCWRKININFTACELCHFNAASARKCAQSSCLISLPTALHMRNRLVISETWKLMQRLKMARETCFAFYPFPALKIWNALTSTRITKSAKKKTENFNVGGVRAYHHHTTFFSSIHWRQAMHTTTQFVPPRQSTPQFDPTHWRNAIKWLAIRTGSSKNRVKFRQNTKLIANRRTNATNTTTTLRMDVERMLALTDSQ